MSQSKVPFGLAQGRLIEPGNVPNGKACGCVCPGCGQPLVAYNQGKVRTTKYFGHLPGVDCAMGVESALHLAAKEVLRQELRMKVPALVVGPDGILAETSEDTGYRTLLVQFTTANYANLVLEQSIVLTPAATALAPQTELFAAVASAPTSAPKVLRPDARGVRSNGDTDWIEIRVTHAVDLEKQRLFQDAGMRVIEVDLRKYLKTPVSLKEVRSEIVDRFANKVWISHPEAPAEIARLKAKRAHEDNLFYASLNVRPRKPAPRFAEDVVRPKPVVANPTAPSADIFLPELRNRLALGATAAWPRHLDLDLPSNGGCLQPPRVWLSQLFIDWVAGRERGRYLVSDLARSVERKFGVRPRFGARDLNQALTKRVLPYWKACGFVTLGDGGVVELTGKAAGIPGRS